MFCPGCESQQFVIIERFSTHQYLTRFISENNPDFQNIQSVIEPILKRDCPDAYEIYQCHCCGLQFSDPMKGGNSTFYDLIYRYMPKTGLRWEYLEFHNDSLDVGSLLDIGCGDGSFVAFTNGLGYDSKGIDFNPTMVDVGKKSGVIIEFVDIDNVHSYLSTEPSFEVYTLWHVLEHLEDPGRTLKEIHDHAKRGSLLVLAVPSDRFYMTVRSSRAITDYPPHHLTRWNEVALEKIGKRCGWTLEKHTYEPVDGALREFGKRFVKSLIIKRNLFGEISSFLSRGRFSENVFCSKYDLCLNTLPIKILGRLCYYFLLLDKNSCTGMGQYARFRKDY